MSDERKQQDQQGGGQQKPGQQQQQQQQNPGQAGKRQVRCEGKAVGFSRAGALL